jgi:type II secretory pathway component GspD/PulD (secretin)
LDAAYELLDNTPEDLIESVNREERRRTVSSSPSRQVSTLDDADDEEDDELTASNMAQADDDGAAEYPAVNPSRVSATDLYQRGKIAIQKGDSATAVQCYMQAYQSGERLDPRKMSEIREYLAQHRAKPKKIQLTASRHAPESDLGEAANEELPRQMIDKVNDQRQVAVDKLRNEVRNASFRAEGMAATDPPKALELLDKAQASVENSGLEERITTQLLKQLAQSRANIKSTEKLNAPRIEMAKRKAEIEQNIKREEQNKIRIDQDFAEKVERYNQLLKEKRFDEAVVLAKEAQLLMPTNPVSEVMLLKAKLAKQDAFNRDLREKKADAFTEIMNDVEIAATQWTKDITMPDARKWKTMTENRARAGYGRPDNRVPTPEEMKIQRSLSREVSLHFENAPLGEVIKRLVVLSEINIVLDPSGLEQEGVSSNTNVSIDVNSIKLKSVLNLMLEPLNLGYTLKNDVLMITSHQKQLGELQTKTYPVADLVMPIRDFGPVVGATGMVSSGFSSGPQGGRSPFGNVGQMNVASAGGQQRQAFAQVDDREARRAGIPRIGLTEPLDGQGILGGGGGVQADFNTLMNLIETTVQPDSWEQLSGPGSMMPYRTTLSLVIRQTQAVHEEIADLLGQLRRLQDLQVTIECRFITVSDNFFERIGVDFNFNVQSNVSNGLPNTFGQALPPFGNGIDFSQTGTTSGNQNGGGGTNGGGNGGGGGGGQTGQGGQQNQQGQTGSTTGSLAGNGSAPFSQSPPINTTDSNNWPRYGNIVGLLPTNTFANNLDIPFQQGSFGIGVPQFGNFNPAAGLQVGFAILSDIETFFLINAAQGDQRTNLLFAPKVTLFNGQTATVTDTRQRPFVTSLIPTVGFGSVGFTPQITVLPEGVQMTVTAVISADRRYVRLTVIPSFTAITDVAQFSFVSGAGNAGVGGGGGGAGQQGFGGGVGGGGGFGGGGFGGIGGAGGGVGGQAGGQTGQQGQQGQQQQGQQGGAGVAITVQQPIFEIVSVATTVSVPDGGTVLLGGIKRLREGRSMAGVPILNKIPYISRLFKNTGVGRETQSLMLMVTPRIIIQEEEEELLGVDLPAR